MRLSVHHYHHLDADFAEAWRLLIEALGSMNRKLETIMATMDDLKAAVQRNSDAEASAVALLQGISQQLKDAKNANDPAALDAAIASLDANTSALAAAVVANTPAA